MSQSVPTSTAASRCPHLVAGDVLGADTVAALLDLVAEREDEFRPGESYSRVEHRARLDTERLDCLRLPDVGPFAERVRERFGAIARSALSQLRIDEAAIEPRELQLASYGDGGHFHAHIDTLETRERVRVLSCVYYFTREPRSFEGGDLRLYGFPGRGDDGAAVATVDVPPATDTLVVFPSWIRHEVLPVRLDSRDWLDRRFAINCWLHRAA